jgi:hypothetical protein
MKLKLAKVVTTTDAKYLCKEITPTVQIDVRTFG